MQKKFFFIYKNVVFHAKIIHFYAIKIFGVQHYFFWGLFFAPPKTCRAPPFDGCAMSQGGAQKRWFYWKTPPFLYHFLNLKKNEKK
jgi:hypothetical protein